jgi:iron complex transport system substrate-binding protein
MARNHRKNDGSLLSIASRKPTVVFTMGGGVRGRSEIAKKLRIKVVDLPYPQRIGDVEAAIRQVATALSREQRGRQLLAQIGALKRTRPSQAADTIWLGGGGRTVTADGLAADWMRLAGLRQRPLPSDRVSLEQLLVAPPGVLLRSDYRSGQYSGEQRWLSHPLARNVKAGRTLPTDGRRWTCMGPTMIGEIVRLRRALNG